MAPACTVTNSERREKNSGIKADTFQLYLPIFKINLRKRRAIPKAEPPPDSPCLMPFSGSWEIGALRRARFLENISSFGKVVKQPIVVLSAAKIKSDEAALNSLLA